MDNLISKIGEVNPKKVLGKVLGFYNKDVLTDFLKSYQDRYYALEKTGKQSRKQVLEQICRKANK